ncbi:MAG: hypothetical protein KDK39_17240 [Leptospiraceae bacterium]|nr:hypothetical protein [Leptospiraceae bacterium]
MKAETEIRRAALLVLIAGLFVILAMGLMASQGGGSQKPWLSPNPGGFRDAMIWFELLDNPEELFQVLGPFEDARGQELRLSMDITNKYDYLFMLAYSLYHIPVFLFVMLINRHAGRRIFSQNRVLYIGIVLAVVMFAADWMENSQLLLLTQAQTPAAVDADVLSALQIWTRLKWAALFLALFLLSLSYSGYFGPGYKLALPLLMAMGSLLGALALSNVAMRSLLQNATLFMALGWLSILVHAAIVYLRSARGQPV